MGGLSFAATSSQAAEGPEVRVCNSPNSIAPIKVWNINSSWYDYLQPDDCGYAPNGNNSARVDVNPEGAGVPDVDSYKVGEVVGTYGACHDNSENSASNPPQPNAAYKNYPGAHC
jgi:hypothetical protein